MTEPQYDPQMYPAGLVPDQGVIPPQPIPTNIRCDKVEIDGEPSARVTVYSLSGLYTFFLSKQVCASFAIPLAEIGQMESTPKLLAPTQADIITLNKLKNN